MKFAMQRRHLVSSLILLNVLLCPITSWAGRWETVPKEPEIEILDRDSLNNPTFMKGELGSLGSIDLDDPQALPSLEAQATGALETILATHFTSGGGEGLELLDVRADDLGSVHIRFAQTLDSVDVQLAQLVLHARLADGEIFALNGNYASGQSLTRQAQMSGETAMGYALAATGVKHFDSVSTPRLVYVLDPISERVRLAYHSRVTYADADYPGVEDLYADAIDGGLVLRNSQSHNVKNWKTYSANGSPGFFGSPPGYPFPFTGHLQCVNDTCTDPNGQSVHDLLGLTYDFFLDQFSRHSYDGQDSELIATHDWASSGGNGNNAFWTPDVHVFGRGDGITFGPLGEDFDIVVHEVTHGVTFHTSGLIYAKTETGGMNESMSDLFAAAAQAWREGGVTADTWKVGERAYTPGLAGDALRYMNDPSADGVSYDRYEDYLAVLEIALDGMGPLPDQHYSSGIPNLAFYLMSEGGTHPRGNINLPFSTLQVTGIGIDKAAQIFYDAQLHYLTPFSKLKRVRFATQQAAADRYGAAASTSVERAWCVVGVEGCAVSSQNHAPEAAFTATCGQSPSQPRTCSFDASGSSDDHFIADYQWTFGDGQTASGRVVQHTYSVGGFYPVTLRVEDAAGLADSTSQEVAAGPSTPSPRQGLWWNPARSGNGVDLQRAQDGRLFLVWFTYRPDGTPIWYTAEGTTFGSEWRGSLRRFLRQPTGAYVSSEVGEVSFDFSSTQQATFRWDFNPLNPVTAAGRTWDGSEPFQFFHFANGGVPVQLTGQWFDPTEPGWGYSIASQGSVQVATTFFYNSDGLPIWAQGVDSTGTSSMNIDVEIPQGTNLHPGASGATQVQFTPIGQLQLQRLSTGTVRARPIYSIPGVGTWNRPLRTIVKLQ